MERKKILEPTPSQCVDRWVEMYFEEKHRAEVAEEALKISCKNCVECPYVIEDNNKYCKAGYGDGTEECDTSKAYLCWAEYFTQRAEARLVELKEEQNAKN